MCLLTLRVLLVSGVRNTEKSVWGFKVLVFWVYAYICVSMCV